MCVKGVPRVFQGCFEGVSRIFQGSVRGVLRTSFLVTQKFYELWWSGELSAYAVIDPRAVVVNCGGILTTVFDPIPDSRDTRVVDVRPRSWGVQQTGKVLHRCYNARFLYLRILVNSNKIVNL